MYWPVRIRALVYEKTDGHCFFCGSPLVSGWHIDHYVAHSLGGSDELSNLVPACESCNLKKGDLPLSALYILRDILADRAGVLRSPACFRAVRSRGHDWVLRRTADRSVYEFYFERNNLRIGR